MHAEGWTPSIAAYHACTSLVVGLLLCYYILAQEGVLVASYGAILSISCCIGITQAYHHGYDADWQNP